MICFKKAEVFRTSEMKKCKNDKKFLNHIQYQDLHVCLTMIS